jgi:hypothetical protein
MADLLYLNNTALLAHLDTHFPQALSWRICPLRPNMLSAAISSLSKQRCNTASLLDVTPSRPPTNNTGQPSVNNTSWTTSSAAGLHSASGNCVRSGTVADALQFVSQTFTMVGRSDPRHISGTTAIDTRINRQIRGYSKDDSPPIRVKPIPIPILHSALSLPLTRSDYRTSSSGMTRSTSTFSIAPCAIYSQQHLSASHLIPRKIVGVVNRLVMGIQAILLLALSLQWHAVCSTSGPCCHLQPHPCVPLDHRSHQFFRLRSQRFYAPPYPACPPL